MNTVKTEKAPRKARRVKPIIVDEVSSEKWVVPAFIEKKALKGFPVPDGHIRVIIIKDCEGMTGNYFEGDIIDLPERRFKSMRFRGLVDEYSGDKAPNRIR